MSIIIAIVLAGGTTALPKLSVEYMSAIRTYAACIETRMVELEPSKADVDDIFEAADTQCAGVRVDSMFVIEDDLDKSAPFPSGKSSQQIGIEILDGAAQMSKSRSRVMILRKRAGLPPIDAQRL